MSQKTGCPIIPLTYSSKWRIVFNSWDRFILPLPCSPAILIHGRPIVVPKDADPRKLGDSARELEEELNRITFNADRFFGHSGNRINGF